MHNPPRDRGQGFTLVELAAVMLVIGLLAGGIIIGRDLIRLAQLRSHLQQIEGYTTAVHAFRSKYGGIPGDLRADLAAAYGFTSRVGGRGHGDGNDLLEFCDGEPTAYGCEYTLFWGDLGMSQLVAGAFPAASDDELAVATAPEASGYFPASRLTSNAQVLITGITAPPSWWWTVLTVQQWSAGSGAVARSVLAADAYALDLKVDDGQPSTGDVRVFRQADGLHGLTLYIGGPQDCTTGGIGMQYNLAFGGPACQLNTSMF